MWSESRHVRDTYGKGERRDREAKEGVGVVRVTAHSDGQGTYPGGSVMRAACLLLLAIINTASMSSSSQAHEQHTEQIKGKGRMAKGR